MRTTILLIGAVFLFSACAKPKDGTENFVDPGGNPNQKAVNETDTSVCGFGRSPDRLEGGRWQLLLRKDKVRFTMIFEFSNKTLWMSNTCSFSSQTVTAYVSSPFSEGTTILGKINLNFRQVTPSTRHAWPEKAEGELSLPFHILNAHRP